MGLFNSNITDGWDTSKLYREKTEEEKTKEFHEAVKNAAAEADFQNTVTMQKMREGTKIDPNNPQSGQIDLDNTFDPVFMAASAGGSLYSGAIKATLRNTVGALADEVTMGGSSLLKGGAKLVKGSAKEIELSAGLKKFQEHSDKTEFAKKEALAYYRKVNTPENIAKVKALDAANNNTDLMYSLNNWNKKFETNPGNPLSISITKLEPHSQLGGRVPAGISGRTIDGNIASFSLQHTGGMNQAKADRLVALWQRPKDRHIDIDTRIKTENYRNIITHEGKHDRTGGDALIGKTQKKDIEDAFYTDDEYIAEHLKFEKNATIDELNELNTNHEYYTTGTEVDAYLGTNFKDELVDAGLIGEVTDNISVDILNEAASRHLGVIDKYYHLIKDEDAFVKMVNKLAYAGTGVGLFNNQMAKE